MEISDKLAYEIQVITGSHLVALLVLTGITVYIWLRAPGGYLLNSYITLVFTIMLWLFSKILKTVAPDVQLRWFFVVTQYAGVYFLGFSLVVFAFAYRHGRLPAPKHLVYLSIVPLISFAAVVTNPWHMLFYSYFDFYKDSFGPMFLPLQAGLYLYLASGIIMLSRGYLHQPALASHPLLGRFLAILTLIPLSVNIYYLLFKFDFVSWPFQFPVFDLTPLCITASLILFIIPAVKYRFLDILPYSYGMVIEHLPCGIGITDRKGSLILKNKKLRNIESRFDLVDGKYIHAKEISITRKSLSSEYRVLTVNDLETIVRLQDQLVEKNANLKQSLNDLEIFHEKQKQLAVARAKRELAQEIHDMLGHTLTVAIGQSELLQRQSDPTLKHQLLSSLKKQLTAGYQTLTDNSLTLSREKDKAVLSSKKLYEELKSLHNNLIRLDIVTQGFAECIDEQIFEAVVSFVREAMTNSIRHGKADSLHIVLRWQNKMLELYAIDNGKGCGEIKRSLGLNGISRRFCDLGGEVRYHSQPEEGFFIYVSVPLTVSRQN